MVAAIPSAARVMEWLDNVPDPELPAVTITDLGIVRDVRWSEEEATLIVGLTPTYSGCPSTGLIAAKVIRTLHDRGLENVRVETRLAPAWTTDWISDRGRKRMLDYGIVPPQSDATGGLAAGPIVTAIVRCPRCHSGDTTELSHFGSTPCKALYRCETCREPFDYVKPH